VRETPSIAIEVTRDLGRRADRHLPRSAERFDAGDGPGGVHVPRHDVPTESVAQFQRAL
jgi:hypothetical protein